MLLIESQLSSILKYVTQVTSEDRSLVYKPNSTKTLKQLVEGQRYYIMVRSRCSLVYASPYFSSNYGPVYTIDLLQGETLVSWDRASFGDCWPTVFPSTIQNATTLGSINAPANVMRGKNMWADVPWSWNWPLTGGTSTVRVSFLIIFATQVLVQIDGDYPQLLVQYTYHGSVFQNPDNMTVYSLNIPTANLPLGSHTITIWVNSMAVYEITQSSASGRCAQGQGFVVFSAKYATTTIQILEPMACDFSYTPLSANAPATIYFTDRSVSNVGPISSWDWAFGDGGISHLQNPDHLYTNPGTYTITLTVKSLGYSASVSKTITIYAADVKPVLAASCYIPEKIDAGQTFSPVLAVDNQGGAGNAFLYFNLKGKRFDIWTSQPLIAYATSVPVPITPHTIDWYLGYTPVQSEYVSVEVFVGPVGKPYTGSRNFPLSIIVPDNPECSIDSDCPEGYRCAGGVCVPIGDGDGGAVPNKTLMIVAGAAIIGGLLLLLLGRKK